MANVNIAHAVGDKQPRHRHYRSGGHYRRERLVHGLDHRLARLVELAQVEVMAHHNNGVVDRRAHLDRRDDHVRHKRSLRLRKVRESEVYPDAALDDEYQYDRTGKGFEREYKNEQHEGDRQDVYEHRVPAECLAQLARTRDVADDEALSLAVVPVGNAAQGVDKRDALLALNGDVRGYYHAVPVHAAQLRLAALKLAAQGVERLL